MAGQRSIAPVRAADIRHFSWMGTLMLMPFSQALNGIFLWDVAILSVTIIGHEAC